ncbi:serine hydrolase [Euhalothece natronophila Z-M001]|uniref:Serine hydrolase n=1 Tax=Euhalothece natronophila Z-M001 TaxID=522448 RepID=A0A5B8NLG5_9CHRO|nr:serine hydrolase [Euhalothece natronophila]QDZ39884.1 serine hydrolase [Euhalothece natronophila Z-M001]
MLQQIPKAKGAFIVFTFLIINILLSSCLREIAQEANENRSDSNSQNSTKLSNDKKNEAYNVKTPPNLKSSPKLEQIIDSLLLLSTQNNLPKEDISITIIDMNQNSFAYYQGDVSRYPASIPKLFWLVIAYSYVDNTLINLEPDLSSSMSKMITKSDNEDASKVIDKITGTESGRMLPEEKFKEWLKKRSQLNSFFKRANYSNINISQKTYPIPYLEEYGDSPKGRELKMRYLGERDENNPIRNKLTTNNSARLMYEIVNKKAISSQYSQKIKNNLERNLNPEYWRDIDPNFEFNPVLAFFGESLSPDVRLLSKAGWTPNTRQEVAYIETPDQEVKYILAIFTENEAYAQNWEIFPKFSELVFNAMTK